VSFPAISQGKLRSLRAQPAASAAPLRELLQEPARRSRLRIAMQTLHVLAVDGGFLAAGVLNKGKAAIQAI
jgi:hypothetical protein